MTTNTPIVNGTFPYAYGGHLSWISTTTARVQPGLFRDSTNRVDMNLGNFGGTSPANTTLNGAINGANGLDAGSLANNTWYALYVIGSSLNEVATATIISTSATTPTLPAPYDVFRRIGWLKTNGSAQFVKFWQSGANGQQYYQWDSPINVLSGGSATTFAAVDLSGAMPPQTPPVWLNIAYTPASAANTASIRPTGSTAAAGSTPIYIKAAAAAQERFVTTRIMPLVPGGVPQVDYQVTSSDAITIDVVGFEDFY